VTEKSLPRLESAKIISKIKTAIFLSISLLSTACVASKGLADDIIPIPAPRQEQIKTQKDDSLPEQEKKAEQRLKGADNAPPFDLAQAKLCETELKRRGVVYRLSEPISDPKGCRAERPLLVTALSKGVKLSSPVTARCEVIQAFDNAVSRVMSPSAITHFEKKLTQIQTSTSYHCRTRYNAKGTKISEHGFANAIDITGFRFEDGSSLKVQPIRDLETSDLKAAKFQAAVRAAGCAFFTTVLGPGSNAEHDDHFHFDLAHRKGGYRLCE